MDRALMMLLSGFLDALNPCALATAGIFGLLLLFLRDSIALLKSFVLHALLFYFLTGFVFQLGWGAEYFSSIVFQVLAIRFYLIAGMLFIGVGIWMIWLRSKVAGGHLRPFVPALVLREPAFLRLLGVLIGMSLAVPVIYWPQHWWVTTVANDMLMPGKVWDAVWGLFWYGIARLWPMLLMAWVYYSIRRNGVCAVLAVKRASLVFAILAAFYAGVGFGLILNFYQKL